MLVCMTNECAAIVMPPEFVSGTSGAGHQLSMQNKDLIGVKPVKMPISLCVIVSMLARATHNDAKICEPIGS